MGSAVSKTAGNVGSLIGNTLVAPIKSIFGRSCKNVCEGIWDVVCFVEHICIPDLIKFLLVCGLCYVCLIFLYMLYKIGVCQCAVKSLCKMCWAASETYCLTLNNICCFCWHKIRNTKRVYRGKHHQPHRQLPRSDEELGYTSSSSSSDEGRNVNYDYGSSLSRKRKFQSRRRQRRTHDKHVRLKSGQLSVHLRGRSRRGRRSSRVKPSHMSSMGSRRRNNSTKFKRQRIIYR